MPEKKPARPKSNKTWAYKPSDLEHEMLLKAMMDNPEFGSISQVVRESVLRFIHAEDRKKVFSDVNDLIEELHGAKERFLKLVLKYSED